MSTTLGGIQTSSSPATSICDLPDDVLVEILCKLVIKDMNSCKYISKLWNFLISKVCLPRIASIPVYSLIFSEEHKEQSFTYVRSSNEDHHTTEIPFEVSGLDTASLPFHPSHNDFQDCCNGLLLYFKQSTLTYYLCNPCTHQYISIPKQPGNVIFKRTSLIFDSHYKLVNMGGPKPKLNIYSLLTRQWSVHNFGPDVSFSQRTWYPRYVFLDGSVYALCMGCYVLKIDLNNPVDCREIEIPDPKASMMEIGCIGASQGDLHYGWSFLMCTKVWTLKIGSGDCPDEWILKYNFSSKYKEDYPNIDKFCTSILAFLPTTHKIIIGNCLGLFFDDLSKEKGLELICLFSSIKEVFPFPYLVYLFSPNFTRIQDLCQGQDQNLLQ